ncbi:hypothetical protein [Candidatus Thiosymbion oneisti]|uniref:hypothetical protein n=1 Tax=Candidatus Thiosymbion oneisti TaxID=589554 RepID=UPI00114CB1DB|nr:hypothetical protein [Candidatus Thiosymbion oneisti]
MNANKRKSVAKGYIIFLSADDTDSHRLKSNRSDPASSFRQGLPESAGAMDCKSGSGLNACDIGLEEDVDVSNITPTIQQFVK